MVRIHAHRRRLGRCTRAHPRPQPRPRLVGRTPPHPLPAPQTHRQQARGRTVNPWAWIGIAALAAWILLMFGLICWPTGKPMLWDDDDIDRDLVLRLEEVLGPYTVADGDQIAIARKLEELTRGWD